MHDILAVAKRHVDEGREVVARQRAMIQQREANGFDTTGPRQTLKSFEEILSDFEEHLRDLEGRLWKQQETRNAQLAIADGPSHN